MGFWGEVVRKARHKTRPLRRREGAEVALNYGNRQQMGLARTVAAERGLTITQWPDTSAGLSKLIQGMIEKYAPLPVTEEQTEQYQTLVGECVAKVESFQAERFATLPEDRASANKAIWTMKGLLRRADAAYTAANVESFVSPATDGSDDDSATEGIAF